MPRLLGSQLKHVGSSINKMDIQVISMALAFGGWVYGGYVRDVLICKADHFNDIDIAIPEYADIDTFLKCLGALGLPMNIYKDINFTYGTNSVNRLIKIHLDNLSIDLIIVKSFYSWCDDHSCDLSCNLFYKTGNCQLGLRYIPETFKYSPDPITDILELTENKEFVVIQENRTSKLEERIAFRETMGWTSQA